MGEPFAENLRLLCSHYASVAEVCRRVGINRQQFNKYLSGASTPSLHTLRKICDFFGVEEGEIFLPAQEFAGLVRVAGQAPADPLATAIGEIAERFSDSQQRLRKYCGYYMSYMRTPAYPGMILRYAMAVFQRGDRTYAKAIERLVDKRNPELGSYISKYLSLVLHAEDRIYLMDHSPVSHQVFALTVIYPSHRTKVQLLSGLGVAVSGGPGRQAFATRMVHEYLGETTNLRRAIAGCGLYPEDSDEIDAAIRARVRNEIGSGEDTLCALEY